MQLKRLLELFYGIPLNLKMLITDIGSVHKERIHGANGKKVNL